MKICPKCGKHYLGDEALCERDGASLVDVDGDQPPDPLLGTTVDGRYEITSLLHEGARCAHYIARSIPLGVECVVKTPLPSWANETNHVERFLREPRILTAIDTEKVVRVWDSGRLPDGRPYTVMERLRGWTLRELLCNDRPIGIGEALEIASQCCDALAGAHAAGVVHRDLKPHHIHVGERALGGPAVKIVDFVTALADGFGPSLDRKGMIFCTAQYTAPEQAAGGAIDARSDVYSLGIVLYEMLCGHAPFEADTFMGILTKQLYEDPVPPSHLVPPVRLPAAVEYFVMQALAKKPGRRQQSMIELGEEIRAAMREIGEEETCGERAESRQRAGDVLCLSHHQPLVDRGGAMVCPLCSPQESGAARPPSWLPEWNGEEPDAEAAATPVEEPDFNREALELIEQRRLDEAYALLFRALEGAPEGWTAIVETDERITAHCWDLQEFMAYCRWRTEAGGLRTNIGWGSPSYARACFLLGHVAIEQRDLQVAAAALYRGLLFEPGHPDLWCELAYTWQLLGNYARAFDYYKRAETERPWALPRQKSRALRGQGSVLIDMKRFDEAEDALRRALAFEPDNPNTLRELEHVTRARRDTE